MFKDPKAQLLMKDLDELVRCFNMVRLSKSDRSRIEAQEKLGVGLSIKQHESIDRGRFDVICELTSVLSKYR